MARELGLPPAALARWTDGIDRRRRLARALHDEPTPRARRITERIEQLRLQLADYRVAAIALHAKLVELEALGSHDAALMRAKLIEISVRIDVIVRAIVDR